MRVTVDDLQAFLAQNPPRRTPSAIRRRALRQVPLAIVLGGMLFAAFGALFMWIFFPWRLTGDLMLNAAARTTPDGVVEVRAETNMSENDRRVFRYEFSFATADGIGRSGVCYQTGGTFDQGARVIVEYLPGDPSIARIQDCRLSRFGWGGCFVAVFPLIGTIVMLFGIRNRRRLRALLAHGTFAAAQIQSVEGTNVQVNNQTRYLVTVVFKDGFADRTSSYSAYGQDANLAREKYDSGATVGLLYDPSNPERVLLVDPLLG